MLDTTALFHLVAGGSAGFVETCVMMPVDLIKVRLQIQRGHDDPSRYSSIFDCVRKIIKQEGFLSFYKGVLPPILGETPKRAVKFFSFEQYKNILSTAFPNNPSLMITLSSLCAGVTEGFISHPFDIIKIQLQSERSQFLNAPSALSKAKQLLAVDPLLTSRLRRGLTSVLARNGTFNTIYLSFYTHTKQFIPENTDKYTAFLYKLGLGTIGGTIGSVANIPFDVAMSRIQSQPLNESTKYRTCIGTISTVYKEEGFLALYKGLLPKIIRLGPGGGLMIIVFEFVNERLKKYAT